MCVKPEQLAWFHMRLRTLVIAGREDLRQLRNKFGLAAMGKGNVTKKDIEDAKYHIGENKT